jgi:hypothetical protein
MQLHEASIRKPGPHKHGQGAAEAHTSSKWVSRLKSR